MTDSVLSMHSIVKHLVIKGTPSRSWLQDFYNNTRYCYELKCVPGQRGLSGHSQRFPSLECEAYPRDLLVDCVWFCSRELMLWSQNSADFTIATAYGDIVVVVSEAFIPLFCNVFVWRLLLFSAILARRL